MLKSRKDVKDYFSKEAATYHFDSYSFDSGSYPANYFRMKIVLDVLKKRKDIKRILDVGCGGCEPMVELLKCGFDVQGVDFSDEMLEQGRLRLKENGFDPKLIYKADFLDKKTLSAEKFDAVLMLGVVGYNKNDDLTMENVSSSLRHGGITFVEFPNELFSFYSFNRFSVDLFMDKFWNFSTIPKELQEELKEFLVKRFDQNISFEDYAEKKKCLGGDVPYPMYNPLTICNLFKKHSMRLDKNHFYHFHALPPIWEYKAPELFTELSIAMEDPEDWRGHFLCSAFLSEAEKIAV